MEMLDSEVYVGESDETSSNRIKSLKSMVRCILTSCGRANQVVGLWGRDRWQQSQRPDDKDSYLLEGIVIDVKLRKIYAKTDI